jgi:hypothetical protein
LVQLLNRRYKSSASVNAKIQVAMLYSNLDAGPRIAQRPKFMNLSFFRMTVEYSRKTDQRARQPSSDSAAVPRVGIWRSFRRRAPLAINSMSVAEQTALLSVKKGAAHNMPLNIRALSLRHLSYIPKQYLS